VQLLKEMSSGTERVAVIFNPDTAPYAIFLPVMEAVAPQVAVTLIRAPVRSTVAIESAINKLASAPSGGLVLLPDVFMALNCQSARKRDPRVWRIVVAGRLQKSRAAAKVAAQRAKRLGCSSED